MGSGVAPIDGGVAGVWTCAGVKAPPPDASEYFVVSGELGDAGLGVCPALPEPAAPPLLMRTMVPEMETPEGPMVMKFPAQTRDSSMPAWITQDIPALI